MYLVCRYRGGLHRAGPEALHGAQVPKIRGVLHRGGLLSAASEPGARAVRHAPGLCAVRRRVDAVLHALRVRDGAEGANHARECEHVDEIWRRLHRHDPE